MPILELPASAVKRLGASQAITGPASVVKELVDNALDAGCQAVFVELTADTLELIQVRDNGCGIAPQDRPLLCKPHCTSKIREFSDIKSVGDHSLGFRGEALARIAELSGCFTVTTRIEGEEAGTALDFAIDGTIQRKDCASHAFGTTVRVANLFKIVPVRRQAALKKSSETLAKVKRMMQAYAFVRPKVRFSLKILKAKDSRGSWNYLPKVNGTMLHVALEVFGSDCSKACSYSELETDGYLVQSLLPNAKADTASINDLGQFLSVDSRPVSSTRGVFKQVVNACKERMKGQVSGELKNPFLWLNIVCPGQSYDPNVEPNKDDVLFEDKEKLLAAVHGLLAFQFPELEKPLLNPPIENDREAQVYQTTLNSAAMLHMKDSTAEVLVEKRRHVTSTMYSFDDIEPPASAGQENTDATNLSDAEEDTQCGLRDPKVSNPWVFAKLHSSTRNRQPLKVSKVLDVPPLCRRTASEMNVDRNNRPSSSANGSTTAPDMSYGAETLPADRPSQSNRSTVPDVQVTTSSQGAEIDVPERSQGFRMAARVQDRAEETGPVNQAQSMPSQDVLDDPLNEFRHAAEGLQPENQILRGMPHEILQLNTRKAKRSHHLVQQKPFISPITNETRNWFRNASIDSSPSKAGSSERPGVRQQRGIRQAFLNAPKFTSKQAVHKQYLEERLPVSKGPSPISVAGWLEQDESVPDRSKPVSATSCGQYEPLLLEQIQGYGKSVEVIWTSSFDWFCCNSERYAKLDAALFDAINGDVHEPLWAAAIPLQPRCSFLSPPINSEEIGEWTGRIVQLANRNNNLQLSHACYGLKKVDLNIANSLLVRESEM